MIAAAADFQQRYFSGSRQYRGGEAVEVVGEEEHRAASPRAPDVVEMFGGAVERGFGI